MLSFIDLTARDFLKKLKNLNTKAVIYGNDWDKERLTMAFVYDDIYYDVIANGYTKEELISFVETLK